VLKISSFVLNISSFVLKISSFVLMLLRCHLRDEDFHPSAHVDDGQAFVL
jgi:hypothetical protein